jgi:hypothetical protein
MNIKSNWLGNIIFKHIGILITLLFRVKRYSTILVLLINIIILLSTPIVAFADIHLTVVIRDCATNLPISGASVKIISANGQPSKVTNCNGQAVLSKVRPGDVIHTIKISHPDYQGITYSAFMPAWSKKGLTLCMNKGSAAPIPILPSPTDMPTATPIPTSTATPIPTSTTKPIPTSTVTPEPTATTIPTKTPSATSTEIDGYILARFSGEISQGEQKQAGEVIIPTGINEFFIKLSWPGSKLRLIVKDPTGKILNPGTGELQIQEYRDLIYAKILQPIPGNWKLDVVGVDIPNKSEPYQISVFSEEAPSTEFLPPTPLVLSTSSGSGGGIVFIFIILGGGGIALYVYADRLRKNRGYNAHRFPPINVPKQGNTRLCVLSGQMIGREISLNGQVVSIGRGSVNSIQIPDASVSRSHALLNYESGRWILYDKGSKYGTFVNGRRIKSYQLQNRDRIQIGYSQLEFREN